MQNVKRKYLCDIETGRIKHKVSGFDNSVARPGERILIQEDVDISKHYYNASTDEIEERKQFPAGNWVGGEYVINLPHNATLLWQGEKYTVDDGVAELMVDQPGEHEIILSHPHYKTETRYIENPEAD
jgi:hypothetical protein|tara:strand:+ start:58 stop:441 length:384 start_codon:yes stop_codon:yes gene_type:complete